MTEGLAVYPCVLEKELNILIAPKTSDSTLLTAASQQ